MKSAYVLSARQPKQDSQYVIVTVLDLDPYSADHSPFYDSNGMLTRECFVKLDYWREIESKIDFASYDSETRTVKLGSLCHLSFSKIEDKYHPGQYKYFTNFSL